MKYFTSLNGLIAGVLLAPVISAQTTDNAPTANQSGVIDEMVVTGRAQEFYRVDDTSFATKTPTDIMEIPQSVQVLTRQLIDDQAARDTRDLYRSVSGVTFFSYSGVTFRGFRQDEVRYDGVRGDPFAGFSVPQLFNTERVEVLKGVSGMLYGAGEPGGLINYVTKKPAFDPSAAVTITAGNRDLAGIQAEATGPLADSGLAYRVSGFYEEVDDFRNNAGSETEALTGGLTWQPGDATQIITQLSYYDINLPGNRLRGVPVDDDGGFLTDISWNTNEKTDFLSLETLIGQIILQHDFSDDLTNNTTLRYVDNDEKQQYHESRGPAVPGSTLYLREFRDQERSNDSYSLTTDFVLTGDWGNTEHTWLFGGDAYRQESDFQARTARQDNPLDPPASLGPVPPLDLLDPEYGQSGFDFLEPYLDTIPYRLSDSEQLRYGLYLQDQIKLNDYWQLVGGARYDRFEDDDAISGASTDNDDISLRGAVIYTPTTATSIFLNYSQGFLPQGIVDPSEGGPFDPEETEQTELGIKSKLFDDRILAGITAYHIVKEGVLIPNPDPNAGTPGVPGSLQVGEVTARGMELDLVGDITENWTFQANYAWNHTRITSGPPGSIGLAVGDEFPNAPEHAAGLWTRYEIDTINSAIAGGIDYVGERISINDQKVKPYTTFDMSWITELNTWKFQLNIRNLLDKEYAASGFIERTGHFPGEPRTFVAQVTRHF